MVLVNQRWTALPGIGAFLAQSPLGTAFTYQGQLKNANGPVNDTCNFQFSLWNAVSDGTQIGPTQTVSGVSVTDGLFTVQLDFGAAAFQGDARWLAIAVQCSGDSAFTGLTPRQALTAAPYAGYALSAPWSGLSGVPAGFADGVDNDTTYTAGTGLTLSGGQFSLPASYSLPQSCDNGQVPKWYPPYWYCQYDNNTTYTAGTGLTLSGGQFSLPASYRLPQSCTNGQLPKWDGSAWACAPDYTAGTGLTLSGGQFSLNVPYRLPQSCANGQLPKWNGSAWACADDIGGGGDITAVNAGTGLTGGGTSGDVTLSADTNVLQRRVTGSCPSGQYLKAINADGSVVCVRSSVWIEKADCQQNWGATMGSCTVSCPTGYLLTGGGCNSEFPSERMKASFPWDLDTWYCQYTDETPTHSWWIEAFVVCLLP